MTPADQPFEDPSDTGLWRPLHALVASVDAGISQVYADAAIKGVKPTWVRELLRLYRTGPMTITELAEAVERTHSALSQKVAAMKAAGLVRTTPGPDARTKHVELTPQARRLAPRLAAEWRATEATLAELEAEIPYPISRAVADMERALARKSFHERMSERLREDPAWRGE
jgi:DNA-binding MarR family transcriptional regulator